MIYILNTTGIFTSLEKCLVSFSTISVEKVRELLLDNNNNVVSAIGHESTAKLLSTLIGKDIPFQRINVDFKAGDKAICFQLTPRAPEGIILTLKEILRNYTFKFNLLEITGYDLNDMLSELAYHNNGFV